VVRSKFKFWFVFWFVFMIIALSGIFWLLANSIHHFIYIDRNTTTLLLGLFFLFIFFIGIVVLKEFKYIIIHKDERHLKWYSILDPFGKKIYLNDYLGIMKNSEYTAYEEIISIYFIDKTWTTSGKINGQYYSNFDEIVTGINLKEVPNKN